MFASRNVYEAQKQPVGMTHMAPGTFAFEIVTSALSILSYVPMKSGGLKLIFLAFIF